MVGALERSESDFIQEMTTVFLRDVYDHAIRVSETVDTFREMVTSLRDTYMTVISNKMNEVMKVLTIIATIFIPITFIAGVYGMNFENMPELKWGASYPIALATHKYPAREDGRLISLVVGRGGEVPPGLACLSRQGAERWARWR